jgi:hypothetical protein
MRISKYACCPSTIQTLRSRIRVCPFALRRELLFTEEAISTSDLERSDIPLPDLHFVDSVANCLYNSAELVSQDVTICELYNNSMVEMQIRAADGRASYFKNHVGVF